MRTIHNVQLLVEGEEGADHHDQAKRSQDHDDAPLQTVAGGACPKVLLTTHCAQWPQTCARTSMCVGTYRLGTRSFHEVNYL